MGWDFRISTGLDGDSSFTGVHHIFVVQLFISALGRMVQFSGEYLTLRGENTRGCSLRGSCSN